MRTESSFAADFGYSPAQSKVNSEMGLSTVQLEREGSSDGRREVAPHLREQRETSRERTTPLAKNTEVGGKEYGAGGDGWYARGGLSGRAGYGGPAGRGHTRGRGGL